ncbi:methylated-DNA--[protein]-cysteine S-methyltransferase [Amaricoccus sp.]|uniref:methylated-DNA--[protein]-cysteine S-methyltransferase n=1 Tax=Amaricoccus sp. TaxID=1872485 RepID=UPI0025BB0A29|nr:MGMT family protein [Amaricoccus sp.]
MEVRAGIGGQAFDTALGRCAVAWSGHGLRRVLLPDREGAVRRRLERMGAGPAPPPPDVAAAIAAIVAHVAGAPAEFGGVLLDEAGVEPFERRVYAALRRVPRGVTTTYGALAEAVGAPGAAREVGVAMGRNPWPIVVPCHRVLAAEGRLGGFSAPGGAETKRRLLALEGVHPGGTPDLPGLFG